MNEVVEDATIRRGRINWFDPDLPPDEAHRWPILLGAYASCVDNCRKTRCRRTEGFHSVLYAAMKRRGADFAFVGARVFFRVAAESIKRDGLNPLYDSLFRGNTEFAPELHLLENEQEAYHRDILKARKSILHIHQAKVGFESLLEIVEGGGKGVALLEESNSQVGLKVRSEHLLPFLTKENNRMLEADGLFIRDPECLLFKEWARDDFESSALGQGFLFTAIAYSNGRPNAALNQSDYYFSLDPERIPGAHIYNVWARLQCEEVGARRVLNGNPTPEEPRGGFETGRGGLNRGSRIHGSMGRTTTGRLLPLHGGALRLPEPADHRICLTIRLRES